MLPSPDERPCGACSAYAQDALLGHARQLIAYTALILGAYLAVSAVVRLA